MNSSFSISEALSYGWETFKKHWKFLLPYFIIVYVLQIGVSLLSSFALVPFGFGVYFVLYILSLVLSIFLGVSVYKTLLMIFSSKEVSLSKNIFCATRKEAWRYFKTSLAFILYLLPVGVGIGILFALVAIVAPTSLWAVPLFILVGCVVVLFCMIYVYRLTFAFFVFLDHKLSIFENIKYSLKITKGNSWKIFGLMFVSGLIMILGLICLFVGIFVAIPVMFLAQVYVYKKLDAAYQAKNGGSVSTPVSVPQADNTVTDIEVQPEEITAPKPAQ